MVFQYNYLRHLYTVPLTERMIVFYYKLNENKRTQQCSKYIAEWFKIQSLGFRINSTCHVVIVQVCESVCRAWGSDSSTEIALDWLALTEHNAIRHCFAICEDHKVVMFWNNRRRRWLVMLSLKKTSWQPIIHRNYMSIRMSPWTRFLD